MDRTMAAVSWGRDCRISEVSLLVAFSTELASVDSFASVRNVHAATTRAWSQRISIY